MRRTLLLVVFTTLACGQAFHSVSPTRVLLEDSFGELAVDSEWIAETPNVAGATVRLQDGAMILTMPGEVSQMITVHRRVDVSVMRGKRIRLKARVKIEGSAGSSARAMMSFTTGNPFPSYRDIVNTSSITSGSWKSIQAVIDVPFEAVTGQVAIAFQGPGTAWFDDVEMSALGSVPPIGTVELSLQQIINLASFARAAALIRYLHPSD